MKSPKELVEEAQNRLLYDAEFYMHVSLAMGTLESLFKEATGEEMAKVLRETAELSASVMLLISENLETEKFPKIDTNEIYKQTRKGIQEWKAGK